MDCLKKVIINPIPTKKHLLYIQYVLLSIVLGPL